MKRSSVALLMAVLYLMVGNAAAVAGVHAPSGSFLNSYFVELLFLPYSFIAGMSEFAGWDGLSLILEIIVFAISIPFFYAVLIVIRSLWLKAKR